MRYVLLFISLSLLAACSSTFENEEARTASRYLKDKYFPTYNEFDIEDSDSVFALGDEAKAFVDKHTARREDMVPKMESLVEAIFSREQFGLAYDDAATSTASQTFESGYANCISMTIMAYSMAEYAGIDTRFMRVDVPDYWTRRSGFSLVNGHVNLRIFARPNGDILNRASKSMVVDFAPRLVTRYFPKTSINKDQILGIFYNNRAAEALLEGNYDLAYRYVKEAILLDPEFDDAWVNLGVLYRFVEQYALAEKAYLHAADLNASNYTAIENLAILYRRKGYRKEASMLEKRVRTARKSNPFYHFILGEEARAEGKFAEAIMHFKRSLRIDRNNHETLYSMGLAMYQVGDSEEAERYLSLAAKRSGEGPDRERYNQKLAWLKSQVKSPQAL